MTDLREINNNKTKEFVCHSSGSRQEPVSLREGLHLISIKRNCLLFVQSLKVRYLSVALFTVAAFYIYFSAQHEFDGGCLVG